MKIGKYNITKEVEYADITEFGINDDGSTNYDDQYDVIGDPYETDQVWWRIETLAGEYKESIPEEDMDFEELKAKALKGEF